MPDLHMDTDRVLETVGILCRAADEARQRAADELASVRSAEWYGPGRDAFIAEAERLAAAIQHRAEEADQLSRRLQREVEEWEEVGRYGIGRFNQLATVAAGIASAPQTRSGGSTASSGSLSLRDGQRVVGDPAGLAKYAQRQQGNTCALYAQGSALRAMGYQVEMDEIKKLGPKVGYYDILGWDNGVGLGKVWDQYGVAYDSFQRDGLLGSGLHSSDDRSAAVQFLTNAVVDGKALVVGIEFDTLYDGIGGVQDNGWPFQGHAVWVTGMITDANGNPAEILLNDSAVGHATRVPIDNFMRAWESKNYQGIATHGTFPIVGVDAISLPVA